MLDFIRNPDGSAVAEEAATKDDLESVVQEIVDGGIVHEGFQYDPYGIHSTADEGHGNDGIAVKGYNWQVGFQGEMMDPVAETIHFGARDYSPVIGRWVEQDPMPAAYVEGANLYQRELGDSIDNVDPLADQRGSMPT